MKYSDDIIRFVLALHWQHITAEGIAKRLRNELNKKLSHRQIVSITENYTARHRGDVATKEEMQKV